MNTTYTIGDTFYLDEVSFSSGALVLKQGGVSYWINGTVGANATVTIEDWFGDDSPELIVLDVTSSLVFTQTLYVGAMGEPQRVTGAQSYSWNGGTNVFTFTTNSPSEVIISWESGTFAYSFYGVYNETYGTPEIYGCNVTAYFIGNVTDTFEVNGTHNYYPDIKPLYFWFDLVTPREYWLGDSEDISSIHIFDEELTTYTINFYDLAGVLDDYPFVEAQRYVNGTLHTVEKRRVDVERKIVMSLVNGVKYNLIIQNGATYTFGDLLMTSITTVQLTLKGIEFPREVELTYKYVRVYGTRSWDVSGTGNITITYEDTLELTTDVDIYINYRNGTNAYNTTIAADSFNHVWTSALNNTDYAVICDINHQRYGEYDWRQYFPRTFSEPPWGLGFLGTLPFDTSIIIPMFLILFVAGCFSQVNAEVGAFMAVLTAIILTYMGWINISAGYLITAFCLAILMGIIYAKRKVHPY